MEHALETLLEKTSDIALRVARRELDEEVLLRWEVVEDRAAGEAGLPLEPRDGRTLVAVLREAAASAVENLLAALRLSLVGDLGHRRVALYKTVQTFYYLAAMVDSAATGVKKTAVSALVAAETVSVLGTG